MPTSSTLPQSPWFNHLLSSPTTIPSLNLFCFPYAGGGASIYRNWSKDLPSQIQVLPLQLPGRENRFQETPYINFFALVSVLAEQIEPYTDLPFSFYGHSMGALLAFEVARHLRQYYGKSPQHLFVGGRAAPHLVSKSPASSKLNNDQLLIELQRHNGIPAAIVNQPDMCELALSIIRADLALLENYDYREGLPLDCSISAFGGWQDQLVSYDDLIAWEQQTNQQFNLKQFPGDHFFLRPLKAELLSSMVQLM